ncbi:MAG TPA: histidinol dehydrogenase, partial [Candidatus Baltobacteraceae bacterium]|nr:histidinol dehydrogenase [Candidatus Baltobacteraceae bacterium]
MKIVSAGDEAALGTFYRAGWDPPEAVRAEVSAILAAVRARGDAALLEYTRRFDFPEATLATLAVPIPDLAHAEARVPPKVAAGLRLARERVGEFHRRQLTPDVEFVDPDGTRNAFVSRPLGSVGAYVPGGSASLPSSVIMTVVPAKVA